MKIVRTFWGDLHRMGDRYPNQIKNAVNDNLNELVYVWGVDNYKFISELGYECKLISEDNFNRDLASDHIFYDHKSPNHKLYTINQALKDWDEILFLDWDCNVTKNLDENFYKILRSGGSLQAPLYIYPKKSIDWMIEETKKEEINPFFTKLKKLIGKYSYEWKDNYIVPNAGLIYCRDKNIDLLKLSIDLNLECLTDEFVITAYVQSKNLSLEDYILNHEPKVITGKLHDEDWWMLLQNKFNDYVTSIVKKDNYFEHR
mgnify:FL=1